MKATLLLKRDHQAIRDLFDLFDRTEDFDEQYEVFARIRVEIDLHMTTEEEIFYPALEKVPALVDLVADARRDHADVRAQIQEVIVGGRTAVDFPERVLTLRDDLERHIETEEGEMFRLAREHYADDAIEALGVRLSARREQLVQERHLQPA